MISVRAGLAALVIIFGGSLGPGSEPVAAQEEGFFQRDRLTGDWGGVRKQ